MPELSLAAHSPRPHAGGSEPPESLGPGLLGDGDQVHGAGHQDVVTRPVLTPQVACAHPRVRGPGVPHQFSGPEPYQAAPARNIRCDGEKSLVQFPHPIPER